MQTRQLNIHDLDAVMDVIASVIPEDSHTQGSPTREIYRPLMADVYLRGTTHRLYGAYERRRTLMGIAGMRLDMPILDCWSLTNLMRHTALDTEYKAVPALVERVLREGKALGYPEYLFYTMKRRFKTFQRRLMGVPGYAEYDRWVEVEIPTETVPEYDLWWGMSGRYTRPHDAVIVRARLKTHPLPPNRRQKMIGTPVGESQSRLPLFGWSKYPVEGAALDGLPLEYI